MGFLQIVIHFTSVRTFLAYFILLLENVYIYHLNMYRLIFFFTKCTMPKCINSLKKMIQIYFSKRPYIKHAIRWYGLHKQQVCPFLSGAWLNSVGILNPIMTDTYRVKKVWTTQWSTRHPVKSSSVIRL